MQSPPLHFREIDHRLKKGKAEIYQKAEKSHPCKNVKNRIDEIKKIDHSLWNENPSDLLSQDKNITSQKALKFKLTIDKVKLFKKQS